MPTHITIKNVETLQICHGSMNAEELGKLKIDSSLFGQPSIPDNASSEVGSQVVIEANYDLAVTHEEKNLLGLSDTVSMNMGKRIVFPLTNHDTMLNKVNRPGRLFDEITAGMTIKLLYSSSNNVLVCVKDDQSDSYPLLNALQYDESNVVTPVNANSSFEVPMFDFGAEQPRLTDMCVWIESDRGIRLSYPVNKIGTVNSLSVARGSYPSVIFAVVEDTQGNSSLIQVITNQSLGPPGSNRRALCAATENTQSDLTRYFRALWGCHRR